MRRPTIEIKHFNQAVQPASPNWICGAECDRAFDCCWRLERVGGADRPGPDCPGPGTYALVPVDELEAMEKVVGAADKYRATDAVYMSTKSNPQQSDRESRDAYNCWENAFAVLLGCLSRLKVIRDA